MKKNKHSNKFKLTPQAYKEILTICGKLAPLQKLDKFGNPLFHKQVKFMGTDIIPGEYSKGEPYKNKLSVAKEPNLINHAVQLVDLYQTRGWDGVNEYVDKVNEIAKNAILKQAAGE